jgi:hypothetical protein
MNENDVEFSADVLDKYDEASGKNQVKYSDEELFDINKEVRSGIKQGIIPKNIGSALSPIPCKIRKTTDYSNIRFNQRGATDEDAQKYVDNAVIMFGQNKGRNLYISKDGSSVLVNYTGVLVTVIPKENFEPHTKYILGHILKVEEFL